MMEQIKPEWEQLIHEAIDLAIEERKLNARIKKMKNKLYKTFKHLPHNLNNQFVDSKGNKILIAKINYNQIHVIMNDKDDKNIAWRTF